MCALWSFMTSHHVSDALSSSICTTYLLSSFWFFLTIKCHGFFSTSSFESSNDCLHSDDFQSSFFHWGVVLHESHLLFIWNSYSDSPLHESLSTKLRGLLGSFNLNDLLIPLAIRQTFSHTSHKHKDSGISIFQTYCLWLLKGLYNFEKESFLSNIPWKLKLSFWKPTISFPFTMSSTSISFHNKYRFWRY